MTKLGLPETASPSEASATFPTERVTRPDPGLARGRWEAPAWGFAVALALILALAVTYLLHRLGILRLRRKGSTG